MTEIKDGEKVQIRQDLEIISGLTIQRLQQGTRGVVVHCIWADMGYVRFSGIDHLYLIHADALEPYAETTP